MEFFSRQTTYKQKYKKKHIPVALREAVWLKNMGKAFSGKCKTTWCPNIVTVFDFQSGHDIPESKGGPTTLENLVPICGRCNQSMGNRYTFQEWCKLANSVSSSSKVVTVPVVKASSYWCCL
jgi:5-methylcytosine-specific restriction endonuclease McrA